VKHVDDSDGTSFREQRRRTGIEHGHLEVAKTRLRAETVGARGRADTVDGSEDGLVFNSLHGGEGQKRGAAVDEPTGTVAMFDFTNDRKQCLQLKAGQTVVVTQGEDDNGWCWGYSTAHTYSIQYSIHHTAYSTAYTTQHTVQHTPHSIHHTAYSTAYTT
jgi:hypothetical protein